MHVHRVMAGPFRLSEFHARHARTFDPQLASRGVAHAGLVLERTSTKSAPRLRVTIASRQAGAIVIRLRRHGQARRLGSRAGRPRRAPGRRTARPDVPPQEQHVLG